MHVINENRNYSSCYIFKVLAGPKYGRTYIMFSQGYYPNPQLFLVRIDPDTLEIIFAHYHEQMMILYLNSEEDKIYGITNSSGLADLWQLNAFDGTIEKNLYT